MRSSAFALCLAVSEALLVTQQPLVPGMPVAARAAAPAMAGEKGPLRATSLKERRKLKLETGAKQPHTPRI